MTAAARNRTATIGVAFGTLILLAVLLVPVVTLVARGGGAGIVALGRDPELRSALGLTVGMATVATIVAIVLGTPLAYVIARRRIPFAPLASAVIELPLLIPHPVAGIALLLAFGRATVPGAMLAQLGVAIVGSRTGIALAMLFVSAPLYVSAAREAIARVDRRYEDVARTLGDNAWTAAWRITMPLSARGLAAAGVVMWARAVSEFGAIVILTYNPKVASVLSYDRFTAYGLDASLPVAAVLVLLAVVPLLALRSLRGTSAADVAM